MKIVDNFISGEEKKYNLKLGKLIASSLTGFICGSIVIFITWYVTSRLPF